MAASWVNLLRSGEARSPVRRDAAAGKVKVSEKTPLTKVGIRKKGSKTQVEVLRFHVASLLKGKQELSLKVEEVSGQYLCRSSSREADNHNTYITPSSAIAKIRIASCAVWTILSSRSRGGRTVQKEICKVPGWSWKVNYRHRPQACSTYIHAYNFINSRIDCVYVPAPASLLQ